MKTESKLKIVHEELYVFENEKRRIEVLGGIKLSGIDRLRVTLKVIKDKNDLYSDSFRNNIDLYNEDELSYFIKRISEQFEISDTEISRELYDLMSELEKYRLERLDISLFPQQQYELNDNEIKEAEKYLKQSNLIKRTQEDIGNSGVVGEETNRLIMFLVFTSRKTANPLHIISIGQSGSGKTHLQEKTGELIPPEDKMEITQLSLNSLFYLGKDELKNKVIIIEDLDGASDVLYPLRELQSKKRITKMISSKNSKGRLITQTYQVKGNVSTASTTTKDKIYEDNVNRSIVIHIDGSEEQTEKILDYQRKLSAGKINKQEEQRIKTLFQNIQRILHPVRIINPYSEKLRIPQHTQNPRRVNQLFLHFIETITFYHQYQRKVKIDTEGKYIETTPEDIKLGYTLLKEVLLNKSDELNLSCRKFFESLKTVLNTEKTETFKSTEIRSKLRLHPSKVRRHLSELIKFGYIEVVEGSKAKGYKYKINDPDYYQSTQSDIESISASILQDIKK